MIADRSMLWSVMAGVLLLAADAQESDGPVIVNPPENEIILQSEQNYTLLCQGKRPMRFQQQEIPEESDDRFYINQRNWTSENESIFWVALDLLNVDRFAVGYYICYDDTINSANILRIVEEPNDTDHVAYVYVYVNGSTLNAPLKTFVVAKSNSKFVIECKPTTPDINVTLTSESALIESGRYLYNPKVGFSVDGNVSLSDTLANFVQCSFGRQSYSVSIDVIVHKLISSHAPKPTVDGGVRYFLEGETFMINCTVTKPKGTPVDLQWVTPEKADRDKINSTTNSNETILHNSLLYKNLTIVNATINEAGTYICKCNNDEDAYSSYTKEFLENPILNFVKTKVNYSLYKKDQQQFIIKIRIQEAYPAPNVTVYRDNLVIPSDGKKYLKIQDSSSFIFKIFSLSAEDTALYNFQFFNGKEINNTFSLECHESPRLFFGTSAPRTFVKGSIATMECKAIGYPRPEIQWIFTDEDGKRMTLTKSPQLNISYSEKALYKSVSTLQLPVKVSGDITCSASNSEGQNTADQKFHVYEIDGGFGIEKADEMWFSEGTSVTLKCLASKYDFVDVTWLDENEEKIENVKLTKKNLSWVAELKMDPITVEQAKLYYCMGTKIDGAEKFRNVTVTVARTQPPRFAGPLKESLTVDQIARVNISCITDAIPPPNITWYKDGSPLVFNDVIQNETWKINMTSVNSTISIYPMQADYGGVYECKVTSQNNTMTKFYNIIVNDDAGDKRKIYISIAGVIFFILIILVVYLAWKIKKEKQFRKELAAAGLLHFKEGVTKSLNPELGIDEQAELLPYDERFEFPPEKLALGKQLGAGAFGVVYKAEARGIINAEENTIVAVKMVKKTADNMYIKALASELKIMVHLGKHINIVNLLGACTKNVGKRELIVIVEYCKFGNIHNYLQKHREVFIDQLNDNVEKSLGKVNRGYSSSSGNSAMTSDYFGSNHTQETDNTFLNTANTNRSARKDHQNPKEIQTKQAELTKVSETGYVQPEWRSNYESDYSFDGRSPRPLCSRDLLAWSFQIARGMEYLASRKILHGDLAARNILLAEDNIIKICDFGLARSICKNDEYQKKENSPLPVKWLAIECMTDRIFTTQSDVWSFGIVLWEIFSLAKSPYPNISPPNLLQKLAEGHRLDRPAYSDDRLYEVMKRCWLQKPTARPTFTQLQEILGSFLEDNVRNHYVDLNAVYMDMNLKQAGEEDYLAMVSAPDYNNLVTPSPHQYVNDARSFFPATPTQLQHDDEGYLQMSPATRQALFNARPQGTKFDFDARKLTPRAEANSYGSESTPMLTLNNLPRSGSESDHDGNVSPYMNMCPKIVEETDDDVFGTKENNVKNNQPISVTNPTYITLSIDDEKKPQKFANSYINVNVPNGLVK